MVDVDISVRHRDYGELKMQNVAPKLSETPGGIRSVASGLGQHNDEVYLGILKLATARYEECKRDRVI
jgi:formyl-CoA transferase